MEGRESGNEDRSARREGWYGRIRKIGRKGEWDEVRKGGGRVRRLNGGEGGRNWRRKSGTHE